MAISVDCPDCGKAYRVGDDKAGLRFRCRSCEAIVTIPAADDWDDADDWGDDWDSTFGASTAEFGRGSTEEQFPLPPVRRRTSRPAAKKGTRKKKTASRSSSSASRAPLFAGIGGGAFVVVGIIVAVLVLGGMRGSAMKQHEEVGDELVSVLEELHSALESVQDRETARQAAARIEAVADRLEKLGERIKSLPKVTISQDRRLREKYEPRFRELQSKMETAGFNAGLKSQAEPTFMAALVRLQQVGNMLQSFSRRQ